MDIEAVYSQRSKDRCYYYTPNGKPIFSPWATSLYKQNWLPPLRVLEEYDQCSNITFNKIVNGYHLEFWYGLDVNDFVDEVKNRFGSNSSKLLYIRRRLESGFTTTSKPPMLNQFFRIGDVTTGFSFDDGLEHRVKILDSSARLETGEPNKRGTGYVVIETID